MIYICIVPLLIWPSPPYLRSLLRDPSPSSLYQVHFTGLYDVHLHCTAAAVANDGLAHALGGVSSRLHALGHRKRDGAD